MRYKSAMTVADFANSPLGERLKRISLLRVAVRFIRQPKYGDERTMWSRIVMNRETEKLVSALGKNLSVLEISGDKWKDFGFRNYKSVRFPSYDVCANALDEKFDFIIAEQVFEHLLWPYRAAKNIHAMLQPGGVFLITTPFLIRIHEEPNDCTRWTATGMKHFLIECGFETVEANSWGNRACVKSNFQQWTAYKAWHSLKNEPSFPVTVWALARKGHGNETLV